MATVRALKRCYCGDPVGLRERGDVFSYVGPQASYLELVSGSWGEPWDGESGEAPAPSEAPIQLTEPDVLPLPAPEPEVTYPDPETRSAVEDRIQPFVDPSAHAPADSPLTPAQTEALDHDGDKKAGGSTPKAGRSPEEEAERAALFAEFKARGVKVFAGSTTEKLRQKLAELTAA